MVEANDEPPTVEPFSPSNTLQSDPPPRERPPPTDPPPTDPPHESISSLTLAEEGCCAERGLSQGVRNPSVTTPDSRRPIDLEFLRRYPVAGSFCSWSPHFVII